MLNYGSFFSKQRIIKGLQLLNVTATLASLWMVIDGNEETSNSEEVIKMITFLYTASSLSDKSVMVPELLLNTFSSGTAFSQLVRTGSAASKLNFLLHLGNILATIVNNPGIGSNSKDQINDERSAMSKANY